MDFLNEINAKYTELEAEVDKALEKAKREEEKLQKLDLKAIDHSTSSQQVPKQLSFNEARARNANLLKAIDMTKARLRSRSTFSPVEQILEKAIENYKRDILNNSPAVHEQKHGKQTEIRQCHEHENIYEILQ